MGSIHPTNHPGPFPVSAPLEVWGGVEATVNRVGNRYHNQLIRSGHVHRIEDLDLFATLGIRAIRYPVLWEMVSPKSPSSPDWHWTDQRLNRLRELGIRPIAGLLHHGSGPQYTDLLDSDFPERLADYALAVATRYPWLTDYTPVNEPLTTARFSALYGHWYPHARDDKSFARALLNQCKATVLAMSAIRSVNPSARLVQTEEIGRTHSTPDMAYQAEHENERRWVSLDLLNGRLVEGDAMFHWLAFAGIDAQEVSWFQQNPCPPDIIAVNYYLTSERFLDERTARYPQVQPGSNGRDVYVDVSALHLLTEGIGGYGSALSEAWDRYGLPVGIGEVHLGGHPEEQLRWLEDAWEDVQWMRSAGVDVRAITAWALLGSYDWTSLVTRQDNHYERGVFDVRGPAPRPTALAEMIRKLAAADSYEHSLLAVPGWWRREDRLFFHATPDDTQPSPDQDGATITRPEARHVLVIGEDSPLQRAVLYECHVRHIPALHFHPGELQESIRAMKAGTAWAIVVTDGAAADFPAALMLDADWAKTIALLARAARKSRVGFALFSNSTAFDGTAAAPYVESQVPKPGSTPGLVLAAEEAARAMNSRALVLRVGCLFGPGEDGILESATTHDAIISPAYLPDVANATLDLLIDGEAGVWHLATAPAIPASHFVSTFRQALGLPEPPGLRHVQHPMLALATERGEIMPAWESAVEHYIDHHRGSILGLLAS